DLVLRHAVVEHGAIAGDKQGSESAGNSHLLHEAALRGGVSVFPRARMAAASVRPQATGVILVDVSLLQKQSSVRVPELDGNRTVQPPLSMRGELRRHTDRAVLDVDQDDLLGFARPAHAAVSPAAAELRRRASQMASAVVAAQIK